MKSILVIHQSAELYGSDKTLWYLVTHLPKEEFKIIVVLPNKGPLQELLEESQIHVEVLPVLKLHRNLFTPKNLIFFAFDFFKCLLSYKKLHENHHFQIVYSNTLAVLAGMFFSKINQIKHVWHVHEIIEHPKTIANLYAKILQKTSVKVICNSNATKLNLINRNEKLSSICTVVHNGILIPKNNISKDHISEIRSCLFKANKNQLVIALVGRISRWKGQKLLLEAFEIVSKLHPNLKLVFVGSPPPNQDFYVEDLKQLIEKSNVNKQIEIIPFQNNIQEIWHAIDIAVVPSTEPEPFGLVAIEAMAAKKPVIAANHGGLTEIIENNVSGLLFKPNQTEDLVNSLDKLINNPDFRNQISEHGFQRVNQLFSIDGYVKSIQNIFNSI